jgi:GTP-binding protein
VAYALNNLQERGELFISPQTALYEGMVIGVSSKGCDMVVNPVREKKLTNMRAAGSDDAIMLTPPRVLTIEWTLDFIAEDELLEVTPRNLRIRKKILSEIERKRVKPISGMLSE